MRAASARGLGAALCLALLSGCPGPSPEQALAQARHEVAAGNHRAAVVSLKSALQGQEGTPELRFLLGRAYAESGDAASAVIELRKALAAGHPADEVVPWLARTMAAQGQGKEMLAEFGHTTLGSPKAQAELLTTLSIAHAAAGQPAEAERTRAQALAIHPAHVPALLLGARALAAARRFDDALRTTQQALDVDPRSVDAWLLRAQLLTAHRSEPVAIQAALDRALAIQPRHLGALAEQVGLALKLADAALARNRLAALQGAWPRHPLTYELTARVALLTDELPLAAEAVQKLLSAVPGDIRALHLAGEVHWRLGALTQAQTHLKKALTLNARDPAVRVLLARVQLAGADAQGVMATLSPMVQPEASVPEALGLAAQAQLMLGNPAEARALVARAARLRPADARFKTALAVLSAPGGGGGVVVGGTTPLSKLAASDPSGVADVALAQTMAGRGDLRGAIKAMLQAEDKQLSNLALPLQRAQWHLRLGEVAKAREAFEHAHRLDRQHLAAVASLADLDLMSGQIESARERLRGQASRLPGHASTQLAYADILARTEADPARVQAAIEAAAKADATSPGPALALVRHHLSRGQATLALDAARRGMAMFASDPDLLEALGQAQLAAGEVQQALATARKVAASRPRDPMPLLQVARAQRAASDVQAASRSLQDALALKPDLTPAQQLMLEMAMADKQWPAALEMAHQQQKRAPQSADGWQWEGAVYVAQRQWEPAVQAMREALKRGGGAPVAMQLHATLRAAGKPVQARDHAEQWLAAHPQHLAMRLAVADQAQKDGDLPLAAQQLAAAVALANDRPDLRLWLAQVAVQRGDKVTAREQLESLAKLGPSFDQQSQVSALLRTIGP